MNQTIEEYNQVVTRCRELFEKKAKDYGTAWRVLRTPSLTDQIFIKAQRIRSIEEKGVAKVEEGVIPEWIGIINYCVMALIQLEKGVLNAPEENETAEHILSLYDHYIQEAQSLMLNKNHDYDEAWRQMRVSSLTDIILMKLLRVKQIEDNEGKTLVSEGIAANYYDMINYAVFAMIKLTL
ncbi:MAG: DUF1599 domain-containing protein [Bacteroidales bacterium]|mgnify:FL=1|jgi:AAA+ ATPase superfamily predicted ATPase|nr:DUF1599 domain-containing protein [Bacteroidales bacterium]HHT52233.1 DUF1599 domain-containing protein [Bacteroidales bacterium]